MRRFFRKISMLLRRPQMKRDLDEEIRFHLESKAAESPDTARRDFGNVGLIRESAREAWGWPAMEGLLRETRYAVRNLKRSRIATLAAIVSLGIGIGVGGAVFSIADAILLRPLDVKDPHELAGLYQRADQGRGYFTTYSYPEYEYLRDHSQSFDGLVAWARLPVNARISDSAERVSSELVTPDYFKVLGVQPVLGRAFMATDENVAVLGYRLWRDRFGSDRQVLGRKVVLNDRPFTIIGVLPPSFQSINLDWGNPAKLWIPMAASAIFRDLPVSNPNTHWMLVAGRLKRGITMGEARAELRAVTAAFFRLHPKADFDRFQPVAMPVQEARFWPAYRASVVNYVGLLSAIAALTLLMACFNVANLTLGRAAARQRELGIQIAVGAGRVRLARALIIETLLLSFAGAAVGLPMASVTPKLFNYFHNPFGLPLNLDVSLNPRVVGFTLLVTCFTALIVGLSPVRLAWRLDVTQLIKSDAAVTPGRRFPLADALVAAQFAICLIALTSAGLFMRTVRHAQQSDPIFRAGDALLVGVDLYSAGYDETRGKLFLGELRSRVQQLPGVQSAAYIKTVPLGGMRGATDVRIGGANSNVQVNTVSPGYFEAAGLGVVLGRDLRESETQSVVVNEAMAQRFWPGEDPIGKTVALPRRSLQFTVAGVVRDGRMRNFREQQIAPCLYLPLAADYQRMITLYVRTAGNPPAFASSVRSVAQELDRNMPFEASTLETHLDTALSKERLAAAMLSGLGVFTTLLAAVGLYGLVSLAVTRRSREIGIRMALGAGRTQVVVAVVKRFAVLLLVGAGVGAAGSAALARFAETLLFGVRPLDPVSVGSGCALLGAVAVAASAFPALRAALMNPVVVLRQD